MTENKLKMFRNERGKKIRQIKVGLKAMLKKEEEKKQRCVQETPSGVRQRLLSVDWTTQDVRGGGGCQCDGLKSEAADRC